MAPARPLALIILDGWGYREEKEANAVALAETPVFDSLLECYPHTLIHTSGEEVGLPVGLMGNSEVGHLNLGAGRVVFQEIMRISNAVRSGELFENEVLLAAIRKSREMGRKLHLMGLLSDGGVHSLQSHLYALLELARREGQRDVLIHCFLDGRDTPPHSGAGYMEELLSEIERQGVGKVATVGGRYWGMDRDRRWDRVERAHRAMVLGEGEKGSHPVEAIKRAYREEITDEFVHPTVIVDSSGEPVGKVEEGDSVIFFNFRADRAREITLALTDPEFSGFKRSAFPRVNFVCMTEYNEEFDLPVAFPPGRLENILADVMADAGLKNLRIAETEKYAHVTFFFNGGEEREFEGEKRVLIPSPSVSTYDLKPEMSAYEVTEKVVKEIKRGAFDVIILNFANPDMVGHTGKLEAAIAACSAVDSCLGQVLGALKKMGGKAIVTADHGNAELMVDPETGEPHTAHTTNPVRLVLVDDDFRGSLREGGALRDVALTMLGMLGLKSPPEMTGRDLRS